MVIKKRKEKKEKNNLLWECVSNEMVLSLY